MNKWGFRVALVLVGASVLCSVCGFVAGLHDADNYAACKDLFRAQGISTASYDPRNDPYTMKPCQALDEKDRDMAWMQVMVSQARASDAQARK